MDNYDNRGKKIFPELPDDFPDELLSEDWAKYIHTQSLKRLNERGGLSITELLMNLNRWKLDYLISKFGYNHKPTQEHVNQLMAFINAGKVA